MNYPQKFWFKIILITVGVSVLFELTYGVILPRLLMKSNDSYIMRWNNFYNTPVNADIVILGSSRVHRHFDPFVIEKKTKLKTENISVAGAKFSFLKLLYSDYLKINKTPKILIFGLDLTGLDSVLYTPSPEYFFPNVTTSCNLSTVPDYILTKYHSSFGYFYYKEIYFNTIESPDLQKHSKGFLSRDIAWDSEKQINIKNVSDGISLKVCASTVDSIMNYISNLNRNNTTCYAVISPEFNEAWKFERNRNEALSVIYKYANKYQVKIFNFSDSLYKINFDKKLFYNYEHLNAKGAEVFSNDISDTINKYFR